MPIIYVVQIIPLSIGGTGFREYAFILLFGTVGMSEETAFLTSVLGFSLVVFTGIIGGILFAAEGILRKSDI